MAQGYTAIYIKPMLWAGSLAYYVGYEPSRPAAGNCERLGSYFLRERRYSSALAVAHGEAKRLGIPVVTCVPYTGL